MTTAKSTSDVGTYDITGLIGNSLLNKNYTIIFVGSNGNKGVYTITKDSYDMTNAKWNYTEAFTYDKTEKTVEVTNLPKGVTVKTYVDNVKTNAGEYTASVTFNYDTTNYNEPTINDLSWAINKAQVEKPTGDSTTFVYDGQTKTYTLAASELYTLSGANLTQTEVGTYNITVALKDITNYEWVDGIQTDLPFIFVINKRAEDVKVQDADGNEIQNPPASIIGAENGLPPNAVFVVSTISGEDTEKITAVENVLKDMLDNRKVLAVYDAKIMVGSTEKQPNGNITIKMQVPTELLGKNFVVFHIHSENDIQTLDDLNADADGFITVTTDKLSEFAFAVQNETANSETNSAANSALLIVIIAGAVVVLGAIIATIICVSRRKAKTK